MALARDRRRLLFHYCPTGPGFCKRFPACQDIANVYHLYRAYQVSPTWESFAPLAAAGPFKWNVDTMMENKALPGTGRRVPPFNSD